MYKFLALFALTAIVFSGCQDDLNKTGYDLLLPGDLVSARKVSIDKASMQSFTVRDERVRTNKPEYNLLGTFNDPVFGKTTADFAAQFRLREFHDFTGATFDSLKLTLLYKELYGDTITTQNLKVYELNEGLDAEDSTRYYQDIDLKSMASNVLLGEINYLPKKLTLYYDSLSNTPGSSVETPLDSVIHDITFTLDPSLAQKLMAFDMGAAGESPNDSFLEYFKGLYIEAGDLSQGGNIMRVRTLGIGSEMTLYYHNAEDTTSIKYRMNTTSARTSRFVHDYSTAQFATSLDNMVQQDSLIYLQTTGGLSSKIYIPTLNNWKDSTDAAINKAELVFQIETALSDSATLPPPQKLILSLIGENGEILDDKGNLIFPSDVTFSEAYYGGTYNKTEGTYRFNLAKHLQEIIKGKVNYGFYLTTDNKNAIFRRVVLKGATSKVGIGFDITYSKIK